MSWGLLSVRMWLSTPLPDVFSDKLIKYSSNIYVVQQDLKAPISEPAWLFNKFQKSV